MTIELDWHEGDEHPDAAWDSPAEPTPFAPERPQTIAKGMRPHSRLRLPGLRWLVIAVGVLLLITALVAGVLLWQAGQGSELARQDIEATIKLLATARQDGDRQLYGDLLDASDPVWREQLLQKQAAGQEQPPAALAVESVQLAGSRATAEVLETQADGRVLRKLAFFNLDDGRWRLAAPRAADFGPKASKDSPHFRVDYRQRDESLAGYLVNLAEGAYVTLCGELRCRGANRPLTLRVEYEAGTRPEPRAGEILVPSPWLVGIDQSGQPDALLYQELARQLARQLAQAKAPEAPAGLLQAIGAWAASDLAGAAAPGAEALQGALQSGNLLPLAAAWEEAVLNDDPAAALATGQVQSMLAYLQARVASDAIGRLLEASPGALDQILRRAWDVDLASFQEQWLLWLGADLVDPPGASTG